MAILGPKMFKNTPKWGRMGLGTPDNHLWALECPFSAHHAPPRAHMGRHRPGPDQPATSTTSHQNQPQLSPNSGKVETCRWGSVAPCKGLGTLNNRPRGPLSPRSACLPPAWRPCEPKLNNFGVDLPFCRASSVFCPQMVFAGLFWARLGPNCVQKSETENWLYLGLDGPDRDSEGTFSLCRSPLVVVSTPQSVLGCFGLCVPTGNGSKTGLQSVKSFFFQK